MKSLQHILFAGALGAVAAFGLPAQAQSGHDHHGTASAVTPTATKAAAGEMSEGEVRKLDKAGKKITLKHGPLKNLDMPAMTMVFQAADPAMLDKVKVGDKVRFVATNPGGKLTVTEIEPVK
jgi:Cu(I)/Ag(I) efflux system periplasmic protein CusF